MEKFEMGLDSHLDIKNVSPQLVLNGLIANGIAMLQEKAGKEIQKGEKQFVKNDSMRQEVFISEEIEL